MTASAPAADLGQTAVCTCGSPYLIRRGPRCACSSCTPDVPVIEVWPVTEGLREVHHLPAAASAAVVELYQGTVHVCCTDLEAINGTERAARAWAEGTGAAYAGRGAA